MPESTSADVARGGSTSVRSATALVGHCLVCRGVVNGARGEPYDCCDCGVKRSPLDVVCWHRRCAVCETYFTAVPLVHRCGRCDAVLEARDASWVPRSPCLRLCFLPLLSLYVIVPMLVLYALGRGLCIARGLLTQPIGAGGAWHACAREYSNSDVCSKWFMAYVLVFGGFAAVISALAYLAYRLMKRACWYVLRRPATAVVRGRASPASAAAAARK